MTYIPAALRRLVLERAAGRCEYCLVPEAMTLVAHEVDHIVAQKHGGATAQENLALSCSICNLHKGSDLASIDPETGEVVPLFHPRRQRWNDHFRLAEGTIVPMSPLGRATARILGLNHADRVSERAIMVTVGLVQAPAR